MSVLKLGKKVLDISPSTSLPTLKHKRIYQHTQVTNQKDRYSYYTSSKQFDTFELFQINHNAFRDFAK